MKELKNFIKGYMHPGRYFNNPNIDDWLYINDIDCNDISEELQFDYEHTMWNPIRGPKYDILQENVIYENINKSYKEKYSFLSVRGQLLSSSKVIDKNDSKIFFVGACVVILLFFVVSIL